METAVLEKIIYDLEMRLLMPEVRASAEKLQEIMAEDFFEFCSSGDLYHYQKSHTWVLVDFRVEIKDFAIKILADDVILATYKAIKHHETRVERKYTLRSSIWKYFDGQWKVIFHQGTLTREF